MAELEDAIPFLRDSVLAVLRLHVVRPASIKKGKPRPAEIGAAFAGTAFCVAANKYLVTAHHIFNDGKARDPGDKFYAFIVPGNGERAFHFPIVGYPVERQDLDLAVLEVGESPIPSIRIRELAVTFESQPDGTRVTTLGFPAPDIAGLGLNDKGEYMGGEFFLKSHANEGIVSAQYLFGGSGMYELNVGWHHGESGGPIVTLRGAPAVFSLMQHYRNIRSPHGTVAGPHRGIALSAIETELGALGVKGVG